MIAFPPFWLLLQYKQFPLSEHAGKRKKNNSKRTKIAQAAHVRFPASFYLTASLQIIACWASTGRLYLKRRGRERGMVDSRGKGGENRKKILHKHTHHFHPSPSNLKEGLVHETEKNRGEDACLKSTSLNWGKPIFQTACLALFFLTFVLLHQAQPRTLFLYTVCTRFVPIPTPVSQIKVLSRLLDAGTLCNGRVGFLLKTSKTFPPP